MATMSHTRTASPATRANLWKGAGLTAFAAVLFPRVNAVIYDHERIWQLDREAAVLAPLVVVVCLALFAAIGTAAWRGTGNRPALVSLVCGVVAILGVLAFFVSAPIMFGGLAITLGVEGLRRAPDRGRRGLAIAGTTLGVLGALAGATLWLVGA